MSVLYKKMAAHIGHRIELASYADGANLAIECVDCQAVIVDANRRRIGIGAFRARPGRRRVVIPAPEQAWHEYRLSTQPNGSVRGYWRTNDDDDDGIPDGKVVDFDRTFPDMETARRWAGKSRVGISGVLVTVYVDGVKE